MNTHVKTMNMVGAEWQNSPQWHRLHIQHKIYIQSCRQKVSHYSNRFTEFSWEVNEGWLPNFSSHLLLTLGGIFITYSLRLLWRSSSNSSNHTFFSLKVKENLSFAYFFVSPQHFIYCKGFICMFSLVLFVFPKQVASAYYASS